MCFAYCEKMLFQYFTVRGVRRLGCRKNGALFENMRFILVESLLKEEKTFYFYITGSYHREHNNIPVHNVIQFRHGQRVFK